MTQFVAVNGLTLNCLVEGNQNGMPLVFINSLGTDLRIWDEVVSHFSDRCRIVRYDKRGHGLSDCPPSPYTIRDLTKDLAGLLDYLDIPQSILVGISVGGMIAMDYAASWPERVMKLVLCDTAAAIGPPQLWTERINAIRDRGMGFLGEIMPTRWFTDSFFEESASAVRGYTNMLTRTPIDGYIGTCEAIRDADLSGIARTIQTPALILCGSEDVATPPQLVRTLLDQLSHASYREIPGAAHLPCIEQPDALAEQIDDFI